MAPLLGTSPEEATTAARSSTPSVLYIDAYDSFSYNVVAMLEETLSVKVTVMTIDSEWPDDNMVDFLRHFEAVVLGPGPGNPRIATDVGIMRDIWRLECANVLPVLGVCLGFQSLCLHYGMEIDRLPFPLHGQVRSLSCSGRDIFSGIEGVEVTLYHSLYAKVKEGAGKPQELEFLAWLPLDDEDLAPTARVQVPMAVRHRKKPYWGFQFHPESCKSKRFACDQLLRRWWDAALLYNKVSGRKVLSSLPETIVGFQQMEEWNALPSIAKTMVNWCASTTNRSESRALLAGNLTPEVLCERLNAPGSPTVSFQSNGRFTIISVLSSGSWRLEYQTSTERVRLWRDLHDEYVRYGPAGQPSQDVTHVDASLSVNRFWDVLRYLMESKKVQQGEESVPFWGGFLGYFSYEMGLACLAHPKTSPELLARRESLSQYTLESAQDPPDVSLLWTERSVVFDNETRRVTIQSTREDDSVPGAWLDQTFRFLSELSSSNIHVDTQNEVAELDFLDSILTKSVIRFPDEDTYKAQVEACKAELAAGESYELCLTCETPIILQSPETAAARATFPWKLYKRLRKYNPAAFSAYAKLGHVKILSSSPECFLNWDRTSTLEMKPMKGTVRKTPDMTLAKAREILGSTKEMAENLMIADLIRHDLYGLCGSGQVRVEKLLEVEDHGRVYQMITHVKGEIDHARLGVAARRLPQLTARTTANMAVHGLTALQQCLPPGSMTGAPKERSCMHLRRIENRKRGIYSGVMGYLDLGGAGSFSVLIRTAFTCSDDENHGDQQQQQQLWRVGAGGAVTTLSTAEGEWDEMLTKLRTVCGIFGPLKSDKGAQ